MRIYTKQGDGGLTRLADGERIPKHDHRVELYGTCDELNSFIGQGIAQLASAERELGGGLQTQQNLLFELGSELAGFTPGGDARVIREEDVSSLEKAMDEFTAALPPMRSFILPGGTPAAATLHVARTVCRRLERMMTADLAQDETASTVDPLGLKYINRLSDYLFLTARRANQMAGAEDIAWHSRAKAEAAQEDAGPPI